MKTLVPSSLTRSCHAERGSSFVNAKLDRSRSIPTLLCTVRASRILSVHYGMASARLIPVLLTLLCFSAPGSNPDRRNSPQAPDFLQAHRCQSHRQQALHVGRSRRRQRIADRHHRPRGRFQEGRAATRREWSLRQHCLYLFLLFSRHQAGVPGHRCRQICSRPLHRLCLVHGGGPAP